MYYQRIVTVPTILTSIRLLLIVPLMSLIATQQWFPALIIFLTAAATDILDGLVARWLKQQTFFGACLDALTDKLLILVSCTMLSMVPLAGFELPSWVILLMFAKESVLVLGGMLLLTRRVLWTIQPQLLGKLAMAMQVLFIFLVLLSQALQWHALWCLEMSLLCMVAVTIAALAQYSLFGIQLVICPHIPLE